MNSRIVAAAIAIAVLVGVAVEARAGYIPYEHIESWEEAVYVGNIQGDPAYYYNEQATPGEFYHALITATNQIKADQWVQPNPDAIEDEPGSYCEHQLWEYRDTPGDGYMPQLFADTYAYDSITLFDDFYGPVTYLYPQAARVYEHPAGGYDRLIVCMGPA